MAVLHSTKLEHPESTVLLWALIISVLLHIVIFASFRFNEQVQPANTLPDKTRSKPLLVQLVKRKPEVKHKQQEIIQDQPPAETAAPSNTEAVIEMVGTEPKSDILSTKKEIHTLDLRSSSANFLHKYTPAIELTKSTNKFTQTQKHVRSTKPSVHSKENHFTYESAGNSVAALC